LFSTSAAENTSIGNQSGHTKITIMVDDEETTFEMSQKQTVLEAALKQELMLHILVKVEFVALVLLESQMVLLK
jgi:hypothetical protein